ncbi:MAG: TipC family immunity protein [Lachnospiraceae bacterium]|nr:TipC family immunity protein [Lachnospiraceae bacterium]
MSKKKIILLSLLFTGMVIVGALYYQQHIITQNVFDEMYYSRVRKHYDWFGGNRSTLFSNMKQLKTISKDTEMYSTQEGIFLESYKEEYLEQNQHIELFFSRQPKVLSISLRWEFSKNGENMFLTYIYDVDSKELSKNPIEITGQKYVTTSTSDVSEVKKFLSRNGLTLAEVQQTYAIFLYDKLLGDWFDINEKYSKFSLEELGEYSLIDKEK